MKAAIDVLDMGIGRKVAVLGDMGELGDNGPALHRAVGQYAAEKGIDLVCAVGELSKEIVAGVSEQFSCKDFESDFTVCEDSNGSRPKTLWFPTTEECAAQIKDIILPGDNVLVKASHSMEFSQIVEVLQNL